MSHNIFRLVAGLIGALSAISAMLIVFRFDPWQTTIIIKFLFLTSLFFALWGISSLTSSFIGETDIPEAFRRGLLLTMSVLTIAVLRQTIDLSIIGMAVVLVFYLAVELSWRHLLDQRKYNDTSRHKF
jgi:Na+-transporting methylmalonyl-CoA/oxaloacetate decarboxylase gamma subunit